MKGHEAVARALAEAGVTTVFGVMGDANMYILADYVNYGLGNYHPAATESGACSMAHGFSRASGTVGFATVTHGPGAANCINAITEAARSKIPMVLMTGSTPAGNPNHMQRIDLVELFKATGAEYRRVELADGVMTGVAEAVAHAANTLGPVILDVPSDLLFEDVADVGSADVVAPGSGDALEADASDLDLALGRIASANRPLLVAGRGALDSEAREALVQLADLLGAPLATTVGAKDLFYGAPFNLGIMGSLGLPRCVDVMTMSDCVVVFGASLNDFTTYKGDILSGSTVIQCDIDPAAFGRFYEPDITLTGDAATVARAMVEHIRSAELSPSPFRVNQMGKEGASREPRDEYSDRSRDGFLDWRTAMVVLDELLPTQRQVVTDSGRFVRAPWRFLHPDNARSFVSASGFGSIGLGIPTAVGAAVARPDVLTVCVAGDGGGMMGLIEFSSAVRFGCPFLLVVLNNSAYVEEYDKLQAAGQDPAFCFNSWPDFAPVAQALGGRGVTVGSEEELVDALKNADLSTGQLLIEVRCDPSASYDD
jgi:acetolactate synthase-1/2/3 large subunit